MKALWLAPLLLAQTALALDEKEFQKLHRELQPDPKATWRTSPYVATTRYKGNAAYIDLDTQKFQPLWNLRAACSNNIFPANGVLNVPNLSGGCTCNYTPSSMALVPRGVLKPEKKK